ncbi:metallophosphoesterase family protein [Roseisolibacter sp. H3M3-2]|uniref:metallophosphoesterase family protein n=1 Tax=Roseisolibacter sp. H3M3-2 TaxID=3031323 RepID=UPI0023DBEBEC|nr:metallophosphoesterase family protein [Roseisolibacter sp. H3M3-2]MDF1505965.1 metallophosphoesterase family protein [Roseisolibacter sp. H3M3-2]
MRLALLADVHGNLRALEAVLRDLAREAPDAVVDLGDCVAGPLQPADTADLLMDRGFVTVRGNHDRQLVTLAPEDMGATDRHADAHLAPRHRAWLAALPATAVVGEVLCVHGTPADDLAYLLEAVAPTGAVAAAPPALVAERLGPTAQRIVACGHTHVPRTTLAADGRLVVNPGSVGLQGFDWDVPHPHRVSVGSPHARYALLDLGDGPPRVTHRAVAYDWDAAAADAMRAGRADWAHALSTGFAV